MRQISRRTYGRWVGWGDAAPGPHERGQPLDVADCRQRRRAPRLQLGLPPDALHTLLEVLDEPVATAGHPQCDGDRGDVAVHVIERGGLDGDHRAAGEVRARRVDVVLGHRADPALCDRARAGLTGVPRTKKGGGGGGCKTCESLVWLL